MQPHLDDNSVIVNIIIQERNIFGLFCFFHLFLLSWEFLTPQESDFSNNLIIIKKNIKKTSLANSSILKKRNKKMKEKMWERGHCKKSCQLEHFSNSLLNQNGKALLLFQYFSLNPIVSTLTLQHRFCSLLFCRCSGISRQVNYQPVGLFAFPLCCVIGCSAS